MAWTQEEINTLETAIKSGMKKVKFKDRESEFRDLEEMKQLLNDAKASLNNNTRKPHCFSSYGRGYQ